jgi:hypothetical protein
VRFEVILTPHFNYSETSQALARGIRLGSHQNLISSGITPTVTIMQPVSIPKEKYNVPSVDLYLYELSEDKDISIKQIIRIIMEAAFDCALNYLRNRVTGKDGSRECDYTTCEYKCTGVNMKAIREGLKENDLDYSTYQLYYINSTGTKIHKRIESLLRQNVKMSLESIIKNLEKEFSEWEIRNALQSLTEKTDRTTAEFDYRQFLEVYSRSSVQKIIKELEKLFQKQFYIELDTIKGHFPSDTEFEIITALKTMIDESVVLVNKYGFPSYLKEENDVYFLVNSLSVSDNFFSMYYTKFPNILVEKSVDEFTSEIYTKSLPGIIRNICKVQTDKEFSRMIKAMPLQIQELFIEAAIDAEDEGVEKNVNVRKFVFDYFKNYINKVGDIWVSTLFEADSGILRCRTASDKSSVWSNCPPNFSEKLKQYKEERKLKLREENPYGIIGKYNPESGKFCIVDFNKEKEAKKRIQKKKKIAGDTDDTRATNPGKVCNEGGWKLPELMMMMIKRLKVNPPDDFKEDEGKETLRDIVNTDARLKQVKTLFTDEEIDGMDRDGLRRILYWGLPPGAGGKRGIKPTCVELHDWFRDNDLLEVDNQCGVQGKVKSTTKKGPVKKIYRIEQLTPKVDQERFKSNKEIPRLMKECFKDDKFRYEINDDKWVLAYVRSKLVGFIIIRQDGKITKMCVTPNYRRENIPKDVMKSLTDFAKVKIVELENADKNYKFLVRRYKTFGFAITKDDSRKTSMEYTEA